MGVGEAEDSEAGERENGALRAESLVGSRRASFCQLPIVHCIFTMVLVKLTASLSLCVFA